MSDNFLIISIILISFAVSLAIKKEIKEELQQMEVSLSLFHPIFM